jgi:hypothetical protein
MKRRDLLTLIGFFAFFQGSVGAKESAHKASDAAPRWSFLGDDDALLETIEDSGQILLACVFQTSLHDVKPPFAKVALRATVVQVVKGDHKQGEKITISFVTDSLPLDEPARAKFIEEAAAGNPGSLKLAFLPGAKSARYEVEWLDVPDFEPDMLEFAIGNCR